MTWQDSINAPVNAQGEYAAKKFYGDPKLAAAYLPVAYALLGGVKNQMALSGVGFGHRMIALPDGTQIRVIRNGNQNLVEIDVLKFIPSQIDNTALVFLFYPKNPENLYGFKVVNDKEGNSTDEPVSQEEYYQGFNLLAEPKKFRYNALRFSNERYSISQATRDTLTKNQFFREVTGEVPANRAMHYYIGMQDNLSCERDGIYYRLDMSLGVYEDGVYLYKIFYTGNIYLSVKNIADDKVVATKLLVEHTSGMNAWFPWSFNADGTKVVGMAYHQYDEKEEYRYRAYVYEVDIKKEINSEGVPVFSVEKKETVYQTTEVTNTTRNLGITETLKTAARKGTDMQVTKSSGLSPQYGGDGTSAATGQDGEYTRTVEYAWGEVTATVYYDEYAAGFEERETPVTEAMNEGIKVAGYPGYWNSLFIPAYHYIEDSSSETKISGTWPISVYFDKENKIVVDTIEFSSYRMTALSSYKTQDRVALDAEGNLRAYVGGDDDGGGSGPTSMVSYTVKNGNQEFSRLVTTFTVESKVTINGKSYPFSNYTYSNEVVKTCSYSSEDQSVYDSNFGCAAEKYVYVYSTETYYPPFSSVLSYRNAMISVSVPGWGLAPSADSIKFNKNYSITDHKETSGSLYSLLVSNGPFSHQIFSTTEFSGVSDYTRDWSLQFKQDSKTTPTGKYDYCFLSPPIPLWGAYSYDAEMELSITDTYSISISGNQSSLLSTGDELSSEDNSKSYNGTSTLTLNTDDLPRVVIYGKDFGVSAPNIIIPVSSQSHDFVGDTAISAIVYKKVKEMQDKELGIPSLNAYISVNPDRIFKLSETNNTTKDSMLIHQAKDILYHPVVTDITSVPYVIDYNWVTRLGKLYYIFNLHGVPVSMNVLFSHIRELHGIFGNLDHKQYTSKDRINLIRSSFGDFSDKLALPDASIYYVTVAKK